MTARTQLNKTRLPARLFGFIDTALPQSLLRSPRAFRISNSPLEFLIHTLCARSFLCCWAVSIAFRKSIRFAFGAGRPSIAFRLLMRSNRTVALSSLIAALPFTGVRFRASKSICARMNSRRAYLTIARPISRSIEDGRSTTVLRVRNSKSGKEHPPPREEIEKRETAALNRLLSRDSQFDQRLSFPF
jgi:hypothetical protein